MTILRKILKEIKNSTSNEAYQCFIMPNGEYIDIVNYPAGRGSHKWIMQYFNSQEDLSDLFYKGAIRLFFEGYDGYLVVSFKFAHRFTEKQKNILFEVFKNKKFFKTILVVEFVMIDGEYGEKETSKEYTLDQFIDEYL